MASLGAPLGVSGLGIFVYNRQSQLLDSFHGEGSAREYAGLEPLATAIAGAASTALRNRVPLSVPDWRRGPFFRAGDSSGPRSALFLPMFSQSELAGILEIECRERARTFSPEEQAALQHVANQAAAALRSQEQQSLREQLFQTGKLAAAGQLMAGIADEIRPPLDALLRLGDSLRGKCGAAEPGVSAMVLEARRAAGIVQQLRAFSTPERREPEAVDLNETISETVRLHRAAPRAGNIPLRLHLSKQRPLALGSREQLSQVLLNLIIYAEQSLPESRAAAEIGIASGLLARRATIEISWPAKAVEADPYRAAADSIETTALSLELCRGIVHSHGGELRVSQPGSQQRLELDLPALDSPALDSIQARAKQPREALGAPGERVVGRQLTVLVVEPEAGSQRHVVSVLTSLGHRVVPVAGAGEGADLAGRLHFDLAVCACRLPGPSLTDFLDRVRNEVDGVILLADAYDPKFARAFQGANITLLTKPADPAAIQRVCQSLEAVKSPALARC